MNNYHFLRNFQNILIFICKLVYYVQQYKDYKIGEYIRKKYIRKV